MAHSIPIFATGIWRDGSASKALESLMDFGIQILSQDDEAQFESMSVLGMLKEKGVDTMQCILTVGTGSGSSQFVLYNEGEEVARCYAKGYRNEPDHSSKLEAMKAILAACSSGKKPSLIIAWGAVYYACKGGPINKDNADLAPAELASKFTKAGFINEEAQSVPMRVIRNIDMGGGRFFKPHWSVTSPTGKYIDLGSGKVARVSLIEYGAHEKNCKFDTEKVMAGDAGEVRDALKMLLCQDLVEDAREKGFLKRSIAALAEVLPRYCGRCAGERLSKDVHRSVG